MFFILYFLYGYIDIPLILMMMDPISCSSSLPNSEANVN